MTAKPEKPFVGKTPRLKDTEFEHVSARIPKVQAEWLEERAAEGFRGRADEIALIIDLAYRDWKADQA